MPLPCSAAQRADMLDFLASNERLLALDVCKRRRNAFWESGFLYSVVDGFILEMAFLGASREQAFPGN
jgi:hypothetical protein